MFEKEVFWKDGFDGEAEGGLIFRSSGNKNQMPLLRKICICKGSLI